MKCGEMASDDMKRAFKAGMDAQVQQYNVPVWCPFCKQLMASGRWSNGRHELRCARCNQVFVIVIDNESLEEMEA